MSGETWAGAPAGNDGWGMGIWLLVAGGLIYVHFSHTDGPIARVL